MVVSGSVIALSSLAGALTFPLSYLGRSTPLSVSGEWLLMLAGGWVLLAGWALWYAVVLRRRSGFSAERALYWSALCHTPLLLCLGLVAALYQSDVGNNLYLTSPYGPLISQPLTKGYLIAAPASAQILRLALRSRSALVGALVLGLIAAGSLLLRVWGLDWGLPGMFHPDEYSGRALRMLVTHDMNPHFFKNPTVMIYTICEVQLVAAQHIPTSHAIVSLFNLPVQDPRGDFLMLLVGRWVGAVAGTLTVVVLYFAGKEILGRKAALISALLLGVSFLHVRNSHYATNDVLATFLLTASFLFSARIYTRGRWSDYLLAALFGGLATSTKYTSSLFVLPILVAHFARPRQKRDGSVLRQQLPLLACGVVSLAAFLIGTPYSLLDFNTFVPDFLFQLELGAEHARGQDLSPTPVLVLNTLSQGLGLVPMVLVLLGGMGLARHDPRRFALLASVPVVYFISISKQSYYFARFAVPLLPFLALFSGYGVTWISSRLGSSRRERLLLPLLVAVTLAQPLALSIGHDLLLSREDTRALAARWIASYTPPNATIAVETHSLMDNPYGWKGDPARGRESYWLHNVKVFWPEKEEEMNEVLRGTYDYAIVTSYGYNSLQGDPSLADMSRRYQELDTVGKLVARFGPGYGNSDVPYAVDDGYTPFWHLFDRERPGPTVKVYQMHH